MSVLPTNLDHMIASSRQLAKRLFIIGENRVELLIVEMQEARGRLLYAAMLVMAVGVLMLMVMLSLSAALVIGLWSYSPVGVLTILMLLYGTLAFLLYGRLIQVLRHGRLFSDTIDQLRRDRASFATSAS